MATDDAYRALSLAGAPADAIVVEVSSKAHGERRLDAAEQTRPLAPVLHVVLGPRFIPSEARQRYREVLLDPTLRVEVEMSSPRPSAPAWSSPTRPSVSTGG